MDNIQGVNLPVYKLCTNECYKGCYKPQCYSLL